MKLLIISEKPAVSRWLAGHVGAKWPTADVSFVHLVPYGNIGFKYPRGLRLQDYPRVAEPVCKLKAWDSWCGAPLALTSSGELVPRVMSKELFSSADQIVFAGDPGHAGVGAFEVIMRDVFEDNRAVACPALTLNSFDTDSLDCAFAALRPFGTAFEQSRQYGRVKRYFDWNWNANALAMLGETQRCAGMPAGAPPLSKYALQLLYELRYEAASTEDDVFRRMAQWAGTGYYRRDDRAKHEGLGSAASRGQIIANLLEAGLLVRTTIHDRCLITVSALGHRLLGLLHPDCKDSDLPFRVKAWCLQGDAAKPAIDRYIKTFFGKQLRFLSL